MSQPGQQRLPRRWLQFSLRTLLILVAAVAALAFAYVKTIEPYRLQRKTMALITNLGGTYKTEDATGWVRYFDKNAQDVVVVDLANCDKPDEYLPHLARLPKLRSLVVGGHAVGDEQLISLRKVANLRGLVLDSTTVSEDAIATLKETLPHLVVYKSERRAVAELEKLGATLSTRWASAYQQDALPLTPPQQATPPAWLYTDAGDAYFGDPSLVVVLKRADSSPFKEGVLQEGVTDSDVGWLSNLVNVGEIDLTRAGVTGSFMSDGTALSSLCILDLSQTQIGDYGLAQIARHGQLKLLYLDMTGVSDDGLRHVAALPKLRHLSLKQTHITDTGIAHLERCAELTYLNIKGTDISAKGIQRLKVALPACSVYSDAPSR